MKKQRKLKHEFCKNVPDKLLSGTIYISVEYGTAVHLCACGCGNEVVTPFSSTDWQLIFDGDTVSLSPSIGNWSFDCQSHYWIRKNKIRWSRKWTHSEIERGRLNDLIKKKIRY